jgi:predicted nucleotidyltransferase
MPELSIDRLSHLPQYPALCFLMEALWQEPSVRALWLGGSLARGAADDYSDLDLRAAVSPDSLDGWWNRDLQELFEGRILAETHLSFDPAIFLYHLLLADGTIVDLLIQSAEKPPYAEPRLVLACREDALAQLLAEPVPISEPDEPSAEGGVIRQALVDYWINTHKHRKVLHRGLDLLVLTGIQMERSLLQRLWYALATGRDYGTGRQASIHGLSNFVRTTMQARGPEALAILGAPTRDRAEIVQAIDQLRDAVSAAGRELAEGLGFDYPAALEEKVREDWAAFLRDFA